MNYLALIKALLGIYKKQAPLAEALGTTQPTVSRWLKGGTIDVAGRDMIEDLAEKHGLIANPHGIGKKKPSTGGGDVQQFNIHGSLGAGGALSVILDEKSGHAVDMDDVDGFWSFPDSVKAGMRNLGKVYALPVRGDSMEPTLPGGSIAFVDLSQNFPQPEDIYALDAGDGLIVKRLKLVPRSENILVISDNERYGSDELHRQDVQVYGRVVAWFQWRG